jgi:two-component system sensor histidine kinase NreB
LNDRHTVYPEALGPNIEQLLLQLDANIEDSLLREQITQSLRQLLEFKFALDESSIVAVTDELGRIQYVNHRFCEISQYAKEELIGKDHRIINSGYHERSFMTELWQTIKSGQVWKGEIKNKAKDGTYYWVNTTIVPFLDEHNKPYQYLAIRNEVTQLKKAEEELKRMMMQVMHIQEEERKRFSRELHDGIGQSLYALIIQVDRMISINHSPELEELRRNVAFIIEDVRGLAWELRPSVLDDLGVVPAIRTYLDNYSEHSGIKVQLQTNIKGRLQAQIETVIYRVIQEALTNISKYADVSDAQVSMLETNGQIEVVIEDQGKGFTRNAQTKGVGLFSMEERVRGIGGQLSIESQAGQGTKVTVRVSKS